MKFTTEEYTEEEIKLNGNQIKGGKLHDKICDYLQDAHKLDENTINNASMGIWMAIEAKDNEIQDLKRELKAIKGLSQRLPNVEFINTKEHWDWGTLLVNWRRSTNYAHSFYEDVWFAACEAVTKYLEKQDIPRLKAEVNRAERLLFNFLPATRIIQWTQREKELQMYFAERNIARFDTDDKFLPRYEV